MSKLLPNPDFLSWLLAAIGKARKELLLVNYLASLREGDKKGPVAQIVSALRKARRRGVDVSIILEGSKLHENYHFYRILKDAGCDVWMDTSITFIHQKVVLVDGRILSVGSHNLTTRALTSHEELALVTRDRASIGRFRKELVQISDQRRTMKGATGEGVGHPANIVAPVVEGKCGGPLVEIKRAISPRAYMMYLWICHLDRGKMRPLEVDATRWVASVGFPKAAISDRRRIIATLDFLDERLGLVRFDRKRFIVERKPVRPAGSDEILFPDAFREYDWHKRLSVEAIHLYFAGEYEKLISPYSPWWRLKRDEIASRYGFQKQLVNRAQMELRRMGLLEVLFEISTSTFKRYIRHMNYFRQNPFYDYDKKMAAIEALAGRYPKKVFNSAKKIIHLIGDDSDVEKIEALCRHVKQASPKHTAKVIRTIKKLAPNSTRYTFAYAEELFGVKV